MRTGMARSRPLLAGIDTGQHRGDQQHLEGARHREAFVAAMAEAPAGGGIVDGKADAAAGRLFGGGDGGAKVERGRGGGPCRRAASSGAGEDQELAAVGDHGLSPCMNAGN